MGDEKEPQPTIEIEIPNLKKTQEKKRKGVTAFWGSGGAASGGAGAGGLGGAAQSAGMMARLVSLLPGFGGAGVGMAAAGVAMVAVTAAVTMTAINAHSPKAAKKPRVAMSDLPTQDRGSGQQASSLGLLSGANAGADPFGDEAKRQAEEAAKAEAARAKAEADAAKGGAEAPAELAQAGQGRPTAVAPSNPFGERKLNAKAIGGLSGSLGMSKNGNLKDFTQKAPSAELGNTAISLPNKGGPMGKFNDQARLQAARVKTLTPGTSASGGALRRAAFLSQQGAKYAGTNDEAARYAAAEAFEPGAGGDKMLQAQAPGASGGGDAASTPGMLGGGAGGGGGYGSVGTPTTPAIDYTPSAADAEPGWMKFIKLMQMLTMICIALLGIMAALDALKWIPGVVGIQAGISIAVGVIGGACSMMGGIVAGLHGQSTLGWVMGLTGALIVTASLSGLASGTAALAGMVGGLAGIGSLTQMLFSDQIQRQRTDKINGDFNKKYDEWHSKYKQEHGGKEPSPDEKNKAADLIKQDINSQGIF